MDQLKEEQHETKEIIINECTLMMTKESIKHSREKSNINIRINSLETTINDLKNLVKGYSIHDSEIPNLLMPHNIQSEIFKNPISTKVDIRIDDKKEFSRAELAKLKFYLSLNKSQLNSEHNSTSKIVLDHNESMKKDLMNLELLRNLKDQRKLDRKSSKKIRELMRYIPYSKAKDK